MVHVLVVRAGCTKCSRVTITSSKLAKNLFLFPHLNLRAENEIKRLSLFKKQFAAICPLGKVLPTGELCRGGFFFGPSFFDMCRPQRLQIRGSCNTFSQPIKMYSRFFILMKNFFKVISVDCHIGQFSHLSQNTFSAQTQNIEKYLK